MNKSVNFPSLHVQLAIASLQEIFRSSGHSGFQNQLHFVVDKFSLFHFFGLS